MSKTKIKIAEIKIFAVNEKKFDGRDYFEYASENGDIFNSTKRFEVGDIVSVYLGKYNNSVVLSYSLKSE